jgi:hypothetical protein
VEVLQAQGFVNIKGEAGGDLLARGYRSSFLKRIKFRFTIPARARAVTAPIARLEVRVLARPLLENELLDMPIEQFLASLRFDQRGKLDQLGIEIGYFA